MASRITITEEVRSTMRIWVAAGGVPWALNVGLRINIVNGIRILNR